MIRIDAIVPQNDIRAISDALKKIDVGGITAYKGWGRGKTIAKEIHASKGTEVFTPEFGERFIVEIVVADEKKNDIIAAIRKSSKFGKIFVSTISEAYDIQTPKKDEQAI